MRSVNKVGDAVSKIRSRNYKIVEECVDGTIRHRVNNAVSQPLERFLMWQIIADTLQEIEEVVQWIVEFSDGSIYPPELFGRSANG